MAKNKGSSGKLTDKLLLLTLLSVDFIWLRSSFGKLTGGKFVDSLAATLGKFASQNPYPWYKNFLQSFAIPNSKLLGNLILLGELFTAASLLIGILYLLLMGRKNRVIYTLLWLGFLTGMLLNVNFWLASAWTGASTDSLNLLMLLLELLGIKYLLIASKKELLI